MEFISTANARRPQTFEELKGQEFVVSTIENSIKNNRFSHAYLFAGPRGVGKTTSARLLAKALNCEKGPTSKPCGKCQSCLSIASASSTDCIEIDGASNTSVDDIRKIKSDIMYPPSQSRYKIYIIDEVHMLSISAFNALLKTIEEPPEYAIFIFATTEIQKVPQTIKSRCQFFHFKAMDSQTIISTIKETCKDNKVEIDNQSLLWIAKEANGSMRDAYTIYDQLVSFSNNKISFDKIKSSLHISSLDTVEEIYKNAYHGRKDKCLDLYLRIKSDGVTNEQFINDIAEYLRSVMLYKNGVKDESVLYMPLSRLDIPEVNDITSEKIELTLSEVFELFRKIKDSVHPDFEMELFITSLSSIQNKYSPLSIAKRLAEIKAEVLASMPSQPSANNDANEIRQFDNNNLDNNIATSIDENVQEKPVKPAKSAKNVADFTENKVEKADDEVQDSEDTLKAVFGDDLI